METIKCHSKIGPFSLYAKIMSFMKSVSSNIMKLNDVGNDTLIFARI